MVEETFEAWIPSDYLREYYSRGVEGDELHVIRFLVEQQRNSPPGEVLCFGCGPTLHHVFSAVPHATAVYLADYLPENLAEIERWKHDAAGAHDWRPFVSYTLSCELGREPSEAEVKERMDLTRERIAGMLPADAGLEHPAGAQYHRRFATVLSPFCADSATGDPATWRRFSRNIASLVAPGGRLLTAALRRCRQYRVGGRFFPSANVDEQDLAAVLREDFEADSVFVEMREVPEHAEQGYAGILLASSKKSA